MSLKLTAELEEGLICCGLMRGITFKVRSITKMITEKKTIIRTGSQLYAKFWISWPSEAWLAAGAASGWAAAVPTAEDTPVWAPAAWTPAARAAPLTAAAPAACEPWWVTAAAVSASAPG